MPKDNPEAQYDRNFYTPWQRKERSREIRQLRRKLQEWSKELKTIQSLVLARTREEYKDRLAQFYVAQIGAVDCADGLLAFAADGILLSPHGWHDETKAPKLPADPASN